MRVSNGVFVGVAAALVIGQVGIADAQVKRVAQPAGVKVLSTVHPDKGFVEDAYAFDGPGGHLALVRADAASFAEVEIIDLAQAGASLARFDITPATTWVTSIAFVVDGNHVLVTGKTADEARVTAFVFDTSGKENRRFGPATDVALTDVNGTQAVAVYNAITRKDGVTHELQLFRVSDGKPLGKKRVLKADVDGFVKPLDLRVLYFRRGYAEVVGLKKGAYDKVKDQRLNDVEAIYDVVEGKVVRATPIGDLVAYTKLLKLRQSNPNHATFALVGDDGRGIDVLGADDKLVRATTTLSFDHYDPKSLQQQLGRDGKLYFSLTIDPVNPAAVNAKKADAVSIDLYVFDPASGKTERLARLPQNERAFTWVVAGGRWAVLRKHKGYGRGGPDLELYDLVGGAK
jgi:hypothetical protein